MAKKKTEPILVPDWYLKLETEYLEAVSRKQEADEELEKVRNIILGMMKLEGLKNMETDLTEVRYVAPSIVRKFNSTDFKNAHPDLYEQYVTEHQKNAYIQVKLK